MAVNKNSKINSVFSGILIPSEAAPQAHNPAVSEGQAAALNKRIEMMEHNIVERLAKRLAEEAAPRPGAAPELENRVFMKVDELVGIVKEQQKETQLNREAREELCKAARRVEELEKSLAVSIEGVKKIKENVPAPALSDELARHISADMEKLMAPVCEVVRALTVRVDGFSEAVARDEKGVHGAFSVIAERLAAVETEIREQLRNNVIDKNLAEASSLQFRQELITAVESKLSGFKEEDGGKLLDILRTESEKFSKDAASLTRSVQGAYADNLETLSSIIREEVLKQTEKIVAAFPSPVVDTIAAASLAARISVLESRLIMARGAIKTFADEMGGGNLEVFVGVSGAALRRNWESTLVIIRQLDNEVDLFSKCKAEALCNLQAIIEIKGR